MLLALFIGKQAYSIFLHPSPIFSLSYSMYIDKIIPIIISNNNDVILNIYINKSEDTLENKSNSLVNILFKLFWRWGITLSNTWDWDKCLFKNIFNIFISFGISFINVFKVSIIAGINSLNPTLNTKVINIYEINMLISRCV